MLNQSMPCSVCCVDALVRFALLMHLNAGIPPLVPGTTQATKSSIQKSNAARDDSIKGVKCWHFIVLGVKPTLGKVDNALLSNHHSRRRARVPKLQAAKQVFITSESSLSSRPKLPIHKNVLSALDAS